MAKSISQILCLLAIVIGSTIGTPVDQCSKSGIIPEEVHVDGCESTVAICKVVFNSILNITVKYKAPHYLESITTKLIGKTSLGEMDLTVDKVDACKGILNTLCPLVPHELIEYKYSAKLVVLPLVPLTLEFSIVDNVLSETVVCFDLDLYPV